MLQTKVPVSSIPSSIGSAPAGGAGRAPVVAGPTPVKPGLTPTPVSMPKSTFSGTVLPGAFHESSAQTSTKSAASAFNVTQATSRVLSQPSISLIPANAISSLLKPILPAAPTLGTAGATPHATTGPTTSSAPPKLAQVVTDISGGAPIPQPHFVGGGPTQPAPSGPQPHFVGNGPIGAGPVNFPNPTGTTTTNTGNPPAPGAGSTPGSSTSSASGTAPTTADLLNSLFGAGASGTQPGGEALITVPTQSTDTGSSGTSSSPTSGTGLVVLLFVAIGAGIAWWWWKHKGPGK